MLISVDAAFTLTLAAPRPYSYQTTKTDHGARMVKALSSLLAFSCALAPAGAYACTALSFRSGENTYVAKNLDWNSGQGLVFVNKRDLEKRAYRASSNALHWTSRFASLTLSQTGREFPWEGMNEAGLSVHALQLAASRVPPKDDPRPELENTQFIQYLLDTAGTVSEAVEQARSVRVRAPSYVHYFLCDESSACATLEDLQGELVVHEGKRLPVRALANDPYSVSLQSLARLKPGDADRMLADPSPASLHRFARATFWAARAEQSEAPIDHAFRALQNLEEHLPGLSTQWSMAFSLDDRALTLTSGRAPQRKTIRLSDFDLSCESNAEILDIDHPSSGDVAKHFRPYEESTNTDLVKRDLRLSPDEMREVAAYPADFTRCSVR